MSIDALRDLRRTRQLHRLGSLDWFDVAYRVYLFGIFGGGLVLWVSSSVRDAEADAATVADVVAHGPALLGLVATVALLAGLRGGANGGPLAVEAPDVAHVLLAPVPRRAALTRPAVQRLRSALFAGAGLGAIAGQLAGRRLPGTVLAWLGSGALFGGTVALLWFGAAVLAHVLRVARWLGTVVGVALVGWQAAGLTVRSVPGPADTTGSLALWGWRQHAADLSGTALAVAGTAAGFALLGRISLDALARRSSLVAQLRFAVTMQDLRTVILLRRQLNQEYTRAVPWRRLPAGGPRTFTRPFTRAVMRRGWRGLMRFPAGRLVRMTALAAVVGALAAATVRGTTPAVVAMALATFVLGLEVLEPLAQEVDQPDRTDGLPVERGELMVRHLLAPALALVPFAVVAAGVAVAATGFDAAGAAAVLAWPVLLAGAAGSVVSVVRDAPDPVREMSSQSFVPPEMAGFSNTVRLLWPLVVSVLGTCTVLLPRAAWRAGDSLVAASVRGALGSLLLVALVAYWVKVRDHVLRRVRAFLQEGREYTSAQRQSARSTT